MPISYSVDRERNVVLVTWVGDVTKDDYRAHLRAMLEDPDALRAGKSLVDLRLANVLPSGAELNAIGNAEALPRLAGQPWKSAVLVGSPVNFGIARQYEMLAQSESTDFVFEDRSAALAWLAKD